MAQLKDLIVNGDAALNGNVVLNHDPTSAMQAATKQYVDNNSGGNEYIIEAPTTLTPTNTSASGSATDFAAAIAALQAGKKVYLKITAEQIQETTSSTTHYLYQLLTGGTDSGLNFCWVDVDWGASEVIFKNILVTVANIVGTIMWALTVQTYAPASGVSF